MKVNQKIILKGIPASPGIAKGKVRIILDPSQTSKMKNGDILVTLMTNPLFVPAIQKAKAIVTDVGGLLSHAAIVSRELGIPCVVGTKRATKILRDNQQIKVDGEKGTIY
jgi:pyruvate,water dikinase